ncbi:DUF4844 domain-containing protein [Tenacibaculum tangerinum]|uniref:DUF4844 domain-containing protein n=1 Tax=Tenacibaculum tangerinum TaxID=3038772 RepID=A0ABY8L4R8_9FLAO|nr:DUF4844 domain-containing protein [Tenacibaculum tangerinum]WGH76266.1 DUF4844 domain-containing protein [Tenacibaculum tangerinum]
MKTPENANEQFTEFIAKKKFVAQPYPNYYPGISDEKMRPIFTEKINEIASDFKNVVESENPTDKDYQKQIAIGLSRFKENYLELDTEDREMVCAYIEQLMNIVGLESSNGQLNKFIYGFDPIEIAKESKWTDEHGNVFIQKGNEVSIIPAKYEKTEKTYKVFIFNETLNEIQVSERIKIQPNKFKVFNMVDTDTLELNNGVKFMFGETYGLEIEDKKSQVSGLGGEFLVKYGVPDEAEWAFVIVPEGEED